VCGQRALAGEAPVYPSWRFWLFAVLGLIVLLSSRHIDGTLNQAVHELRQRFPVYSAETTNGKEAEFIRDRLPKRIPVWTLLIAVIVLGGLAWWLGQ
jgi:hypothetical protein